MSWAIEEKGYSQRRACGLIGLEPKTYRYASTRVDDAAVRVTYDDDVDLAGDPKAEDEIEVREVGEDRQPGRHAALHGWKPRDTNRRSAQRCRPFKLKQSPCTPSP